MSLHSEMNAAENEYTQSDNEGNDIYDTMSHCRARLGVGGIAKG